MVLNENDCSNALYNVNYRELHVSTLMRFWLQSVKHLKAQLSKNTIFPFLYEMDTKMSECLLSNFKVTQ